MALKNKFFGEELKRQVAAAVEAGLAAGLDVAQEVIREEILVQVFPRSSPGEQPRAETHNLEQSMFNRVVETTRGKPKVRGLVGNEAEYAGALELGTSRMAPRPFIVRGFEERKDDIAGVMFTEAKRQME